MGLDPRIFGMVQNQAPQFNPLAELGQVQQLQAGQQQNKLHMLALQDRERGIADQMVMRNALVGLPPDATDDDRITALKRTGLPAGFMQADALQKGMLDRQKTGADVAKTTAETADKTFGTLQKVFGSVQNPQQAASVLQAAYADPSTAPIMRRFGTLEEGMDVLQKASTDPAMFQQWRAQVAIGVDGLAKSAKVNNVNLGGTMQTQLVQPATGQVQTLASAPITQDANSIASNARMAAEGAANRAVSMRGQELTRRGQDLTDARSREFNTVTKQTAADAKQQAASEKAVTKFSDTLQKEGIPELETAISGAEGALSRYEKGAVPGIGPLKNMLPSAVMSAEGKDVRQALASVRNIVLSARSGAAVTDQELRRLVEEIGTGAGMTEDDIRKGLTKVRARLDAIKSNAAAGVDDATLRTYGERGGIPIRRGGAAPAAPPGRSAVDAALEKYR